MAKRILTFSEADAARFRELSDDERRRANIGYQRDADKPISGRQDCGWYINESGYEVPEGGLVYLGTQSTLYAQLPAGTRPANPGLVTLGVSCKAVANGQRGAYWGLDGIPRKVRTTGWAGLAVGDRIGATTGSFDAGANPLGPFLITAKLTSPYVLALFTGERGDHVYVDGGTAATSGAAAYIVWGTGYSRDTSTRGAPGVS